MSGRPVLQELNRKIQAAGGDDVIFDGIAAGVPIGKIAQEFGVSRSYLYVWRKQPPEDLAEERLRRWEDAMELSAEAKEEEGAEILDELAERGIPPTSAEVQLANSRANYRKWQAEVRSGKYAPKGKLDVEVSGSIEHAHLEVLRQLGGPRQEIEEGEVVEAELIEEPGDDAVAELKGA